MEKTKKIAHTNKKYHEVSDINFEENFISFLADGKFYKVDLRKQSLKLARSDIKVKNNFRISPSGYGIHWEDIDEDLTINGLIDSAEKSFNYSKIKPRKLIIRDKNIKKRSRNNS